MHTSIMSDVERDMKQMAREACLQAQAWHSSKLDPPTVPCSTNCYNLKLHLIANEVCKPYLSYAVIYAYKEEEN